MKKHSKGYSVAQRCAEYPLFCYKKYEIARYWNVVFKRRHILHTLPK